MLLLSDTADPPTLYFFLLVLEKRNVMLLLLLFALLLYLSLLLYSRLCYLVRSPHCIWSVPPSQPPPGLPSWDHSGSRSSICFCQQDLILLSASIRSACMRAVYYTVFYIPNAKHFLSVTVYTVSAMTDTVSFEAAHSHHIHINYCRSVCCLHGNYLLLT
jgi:hypothetical protein